MNNYDWQKIDILIPNELFAVENPKQTTEENLGIFDIFDLYNFTVREDEPLEKEVAVDPEMLGKVFENLLEVKDRKSKGAFYTPREIVHYMCQESLINYLNTALENTVPHDELVTLIRFGQAIKEMEKTTQGKEKETNTYYFRMPEVRNRATELDEALANIQICDPAIGSGAFPVGMMQEIVKARDVLTEYYDNKDGRSMYNFKRHAIQTSIYGVDIDPSAIDIAKLRLWLSLVVDEDDYYSIKPLPNLDYKIVCGNSLLSVKKDLFNAPLLSELKKLKDKHFDETDPDIKQAQRSKIDKLIEQLTETDGQFDIEIYFSEVFQEEDGGKGGFDLVIGNPPYLRIQGLRQDDPKLADTYKKEFDSATGSFDLYVLFVEKGLRILNEKGQLNFIMPDKWTNAGFGQGLRKVVADHKHAHRLVSFGAYQVFNASTYSSLLWLTKRPNQQLMYYGFNQDLTTTYELAIALNRLLQDGFYPIPSDNLTDANWVLTNRTIGEILTKMERQSRRLSDIFPHMFQGIATSRDSVYFLTNCTIRENLVEGYSKELDRRVSIEQGLTKPLLKGDQVHRYVSLQTDNYVVFPYQLNQDNNREKSEVMSPQNIQKNFPLGWAYLIDCEEVLKSRENGRLANDRDWYRYIYPKNGTLFEKEKLVSPDISLGGNFAYDAQGQFYMTTTVYGYIKNVNVEESYRFWLALMNSKLVWFYLQNTGSVLANGYYRYKPAYLENFPIPEKIEPQQEKVFLTLVDYISHIKAQVDVKSSAHARDAVMLSYYEQIVDALVYELYFPEELHSYDRYFMRLMQRENLPTLNQSQENQIRQLRQIFERLFETNHPVRQNLFFLDSVSIVRTIEGKE